MSAPRPGRGVAADGTAPVVLLVGRRRMARLARAIEAAAPGAECILAETAAAGEPHLARAQIVILADVATPAYAAAPRLRWLHLYPTGIDHVAVPALREAPFAMTRKIAASAVPMAEHAMALLLAIARRLPDFRDLQVAADWRDHAGWPASGLGQLAGATLAIVGLGQAGRALARRAAAFDMRVLGVRRSVGEPVPGVARQEPAERLLTVLAEADYAVLMAPLDDTTYRMIGRAELAALRPSAWLVNVARGALVDEGALLDALRAGTIGGAALDVFDAEPLPPDHPLWRQANVIVTPHVAGSGPENEREATAEILANLHRWLAGAPLAGLVRPEEVPTRPELVPAAARGTG
jgi:phosphoglycerate dehydrogenase-like enzyme